MTDSLPDLAGLLDAWRRCGTGQRDGMRRHRIEALAARAVRLEGSARDVLDARLRLLMEQDLPAQARADAAPPADRDASALYEPPSPTAELSALVLRLSGIRTMRGDSATLDSAATTSTVDGDADTIAASGATNQAQDPDDGGFQSLPALDAIRRTWARLRTASHLQHIMADVPEDAGPMHSTVLVHRAIALMHDTAPDYLQHFLGYADALAGLERISPTPATTPAPRSPRPLRPASPANASRPRKAPRRRSRGRPRPA
ncbi:DUF2894 domain-containing protein [Luteimonas sp. A482]